MSLTNFNLTTESQSTNSTASPVNSQDDGCISPEEVVFRNFGNVLLRNISPRELLNFNQASKMLNTQSSDLTLWQNLLNKHFPYVRGQQSSAYQTAPKALFVRTFEETLANIEHPDVALLKPYLLAVLRGDIGKIETAQLSDELKRILFIQSAANGHVTAILKLNYAERIIALNLAIKRGYLHGVQRLVDYINTAKNFNAYSESVLLAMQMGFYNIADELTNDFNPGNTYRETVLSITKANGHRKLYFAACNGNSDKIAQYLEAGIPPILKDSSDDPLIIAVLHGYEKAVRQLVKAGINLNEMDSLFPFTTGEIFLPLFRAVQSHNVAMVKLLIELGADVNVTGLRPRTQFGLPFIIEEVLKDFDAELFAAVYEHIKDKQAIIEFAKKYSGKGRLYQWLVDNKHIEEPVSLENAPSLTPMNNLAKQRDLEKDEQKQSEATLARGKENRIK